MTLRKAPPPPKDWEEIRRSHREGEASRQRYRITSRHKIHGNPPGEVAYLELTNGERDALIEGGHIMPAPEPPQKPEPERASVLPKHKRKGD